MSAYMRSTCGSDVRSYWRLRGTSTVLPRRSSTPTTCCPRNPLPPVTTTRFPARLVIGAPRVDVRPSDCPSRGRPGSGGGNNGAPAGRVDNRLVLVEGGVQQHA